MFLCIKKLKIVHQYGGVYHFLVGQRVSYADLIKMGVKPSPKYFTALGE